MDEAIIFRALTVVILALFSCVFGGLFLFDRKQVFAGWLAITFLSGLAAFVLDIGREFLDPTLSDLAAKAAFWTFSIAMTIGIYRRYAVPFPWTRIAGLVFVGGAGLLWFSFVNPDIISRSFISATIAGLILVYSLIPLGNHHRGVLERIMFVLIAVIVLTYLLRPIIIYGFFGLSYTAANYHQSAYALVLHSTSALSALACGVVMLIVIGNDIITKHHLATKTDPLTGLLNRRGIDEFVAVELAEDKGLGRAVMIADLDRFKQVNDLYGHDAGDQVLKRVSAALRSLVASLGQVARIGGEEFIIILDAISSQDRAVVAQHLRLAIGMIHHPELPERDNVTVSIGVARIDAGETYQMALRRADMALYAAKAKGRNRVVDASEISPSPVVLQAGNRI